MKMRKISVLLMALLSGLTMNAKDIMFSYFDQYNNLYPDCVDDEDSKVYPIDEPYLTEPEFPGGGRVQMTRYVYFSTEYPDVKGPDGEQLKGKVLIKTIVDRCGVAKNVEVIQSLSDQQDAEAVRVVESFPIMKPGSLDGVRVKVAMIVPVYFTKTYVPKKESSYDDYDYDYDYDGGSYSGSSSSSSDYDDYDDYDYNSSSSGSYYNYDDYDYDY